MLLAKSRPIVVIFIADGSHFARERLTAFTPWHLDAVSGSHPPHLLIGADWDSAARGQSEVIDHLWTPFDLGQQDSAALCSDQASGSYGGASITRSNCCQKWPGRLSSSRRS